MRKVLTAQVVLLALLTINLTACFLAEKSAKSDQYLGVYSSVTESECNMEIVLRPASSGKAVQICRIEDGSHEDAIVETSLKWEIKDGIIVIQCANAEVDFFYDAALSCESFAAKGVSSGLVLKTKGNNIFDGYGDRFWKNIDNCK